MKKSILALLILLLSTCVATVASAQTFTVPALNRYSINLGLSSGDKVSGSLSVVGGSGNDINFYVADPNGNTILRYDRITQTSFSFTASTTGTYIMNFDNSFSLFSSKSVTLDYSVAPAIAGIPQDYLLIILAIIIVVVVIVALIALAMRRKNQKLHETSSKA